MWEAERKFDEDKALAEARAEMQASSFRHLACSAAQCLGTVRAEDRFGPLDFWDFVPIVIQLAATRAVIIVVWLTDGEGPFGRCECHRGFH